MQNISNMTVEILIGINTTIENGERGQKKRRTHNKISITTAITENMRINNILYKTKKQQTNENTLQKYQKQTNVVDKLIKERKKITFISDQKKPDKTSY